MTYAEYLAYLRSPWWVARKAAIIRYRGYRCERCGAEPNTGLELHHRTYDRLYHELPDDLQLLCWECHRREHGFDHDPRRRWWWEKEQIDPVTEVIRIVRRQYGIDLNRRLEE